jgi:2-keto-3-deoxy-L-rhamnonate aldolase RhmA
MNLIIQTIPSPLVSEVLCQSFMDGIILDTEHGCFNNETLYSCIQTITLSNKQCYVRFTDLNKQLVRMCLDAGVDGVVFSTIESVEETKDIIKYCTYPSQGGKRGCGLVRQNKWGDDKLDKHRPIIIGQIETKAAIEKIWEFKEECELDLFLIGPYDISSSLGVAGQWNNKLYIKYINEIYRTFPLNKLGLFLSNEEIKKFDSTKEHPYFLVWGIDVSLIKENLNNMKNNSYGN